MLLAAGLGKRLRPLTYLMPKPLAPVLNRPVMEHGLRRLEEHGFKEVVSNISYLPEQITGRFGDGSELGLSITWSEESEPLGTAGGVQKAADFLSETDSFLILSGDGLTDIDLTAMRKAHEAHDGIATLATKRVDDTSEFGVVITGDDGRVQGFQEKPDPAEALSNLANCGIYMFRREIFDHFPGEGHTSPAGDPDQPEGFVDWAMDVFPALLEHDVPFYSHEIDAYWNDIGNVAEFVQGNFDALAGDVSVDVGVPEAADGIYAAEGIDLDRLTIQGPVLIGEGAELGDGVELHGPVVVGDGARVGAGARIRDAVLLPGAELGAGAVAIGGAYGLDATAG
jgi:mannose-1-phosphate guanylyltransferase/mannose-1-phosphate guanylyltransferase/phosphomannomutase